MNPVAWNLLGANHIDLLILLIPIPQIFAKYIRAVLRTFQTSGPITNYFVSNHELQHSFGVRFYLGSSDFTTYIVHVHPMDRRVIILWPLSNSS